MEADFSLITAMLPKGKAPPLVERLKDELGVTTTDVASGRGQGLVGATTFGDWAEVDMLTVAVPSRQAKAVFEFLYVAAGIAEPHGGLLYQHPIGRLTRMGTAPGDLPRETAAHS